MRSSRHKNAPRWSATSCSPTDLLRSTIGARGLNFWVRNGTRCASPAMVADQQGAFLCREDLTFVGSSFFGSYRICLLDVFVWIWNSTFEVILYVERLLDKSHSILNSENYVFRVSGYIGVILVVSLIQYNQPLWGNLSGICEKGWSQQTCLQKLYK